ncbi:kinase-like domain-containing protein [Diplogelasinospora grovesii]|uniref:non-specific serine/threonine protein kinase n=1 Tax=Diplogelasinospora grovesii TaxID=303347 RepID=A0AAN6NAT7_9PEZI|nr:kinase-like domain-containing protein [Diplogelasinospora grovesii]
MRPRICPAKRLVREILPLCSPRSPLVRRPFYPSPSVRHPFFTPKMIDHLQYTAGVPAEDISRYGPGGYHPIHLGDLLKDGRYRIRDKLGFGSFSTVWLARDDEKQMNVSIKVVVASKSEEHNHELEILERVREKGDPQHPGRKHVSHLLDSFYHEGPNGRHLCLVLELLGPKMSLVAERRPGYRLGGRLAREISAQLLLAVDYIKSCDVAHGDIHMGNILFRLPDSKQVPPAADTCRVGKVSKKDRSPVEKGVPEYVVEPAEYGFQEGQQHLDEIQLVDFGQAFFISCPPKSINTPMSLHPPELVFRHPLTNAVDIWNLGSTTYELVTGRTPFEADFDDRELIPQFQKVLGGVPEQWIRDALGNGVLAEKPDESSADGFLSLEEEIQRSYVNGHDSETLELGEKDLELLGRFLRMMLVVEPEKRATSSELKTHPWVSGKL